MTDFYKTIDNITVSQLTPHSPLDLEVNYNNVVKKRVELRGNSPLQVARDMRYMFDCAIKHLESMGHEN